MKTKNRFLAADRGILADSGSSGAVETCLLTLCDDIGPRFAGTEGYRRAAEFMRGRFEACGLDRVALEPFEFTVWRRGAPATMELLAPFPRDFACFALPYGAATEPAGVAAGIVDIGTGSHSEIDQRRELLQGQFALTTGTATHRTEIYANCMAAGAAGFIMSSPSEGMILATGSVAEGYDGAIPAVSIGKESALELQRLAKNHTLQLRLTASAVLEQDTTWNVIGELRGTERPDELVIMGGHLDSHDIGPGAFDNGAGAVMVMEVARLLAGQRQHLKRTVRFIGFAAEEIGLLGSHHHAAAHSEELQKGRFMLNCDTPALGRPRGLAFHKCPTAAPYMAKLAENMETELLCQSRAHCHSDHYPFILQGLPTAGIAGGRFAAPVQYHVHTAADTPDKVSISDLCDAAAMAARLLLRAASDEDWPEMRRSPSEVAAWAKGTP